MGHAASSSVVVRPATPLDLPVVQRLAHAIWHLHYPGIISVAQIDFMLARGYSDAALAQFCEDAGAGLALAALDAEDVGYAAWRRSKIAGTTHLDKLYVLPHLHGTGIGRRLIAHVEAAARADGSTSLALNVNRNNAGSIAAYRKWGFRVRETVVADIGGGFFIDDYVMARDITPADRDDLR